MSQPRLNMVSIAVSEYLGDQVSTAIDNGKTYSSAERLEAINRARQQMYLKALGDLGLEKFKEYYPEYVDVAVKTLLPSKSPDIRKTFKVLNNVNSIVEELPTEEYFNSQNDPYSKWKVSENNRKFLEYGNKVDVLGDTLVNTASIIYLKQPIDIAQGENNPDMSEPTIWTEDIIRLATEIATGSHGNYTETEADTVVNYLRQNTENLTYNYNTGKKQTFVFPEPIDCTNEIRVFLKTGTNYRNYTTILASDGSVYYINLEELTVGVSRSDNILSFTFENETIEITIVDSTVATDFKTVVNLSRFSVNFDPLTANYTVNDIGDLQTTIDGATFGESIVIEAGVYTVTVTINFKNGVTIYCNPGVIFTSDSDFSSTMFSDPSAMAVKFLGHAEIIMNGTEACYVWAMAHDSTGYFEFKSIVSQTNFTVFYNPEGVQGFFYLKGLSVTSAHRIFDTDGLSRGADIDIIICESGTEFCYPSSSYDGTKYCIKNCFSETFDATISQFVLEDSVAITYLICINVIFKGGFESFYIPAAALNIGTKLYFGNSYLSAESAAFNTLGTPMTLTIFNAVFSDKNKGVDVEKAGEGNYFLDKTLNSKLMSANVIVVTAIIGALETDYDIDCLRANVYNLSFESAVDLNIINPTSGEFVTVFIKSTSGSYPAITWNVPSGYTLKFPNNEIPVTNDPNVTDRYDFTCIGTVIYGSVIQNYLP